MKTNDNNVPRLSSGHANILEKLKELYPSLTIKNEYYIDGLYLDIYLPSLKIAIEVDGGQHTDVNHYFHSNLSMAYASQLNDIRKEELCSKEDIILIHVDNKTAANMNKNQVQKLIYKGVFDEASAKSENMA